MVAGCSRTRYTSLLCPGSATAASCQHTDTEIAHRHRDNNKTDINLSCEKVLKENYDGQLRLYAKALEAMGEQVESCYLYGVRHHDLFKVEKGD